MPSMGDYPCDEQMRQGAGPGGSVVTAAACWAAGVVGLHALGIGGEGGCARRQEHGEQEATNIVQARQNR